MINEYLSVAPMMEMTDRHYRYFMRGLTKKTVLYTEMVVDDAVNHSPNLNFLIGKDIEEQPSVIQLGTPQPSCNLPQHLLMLVYRLKGGSNPETLGMATEVCSVYGGNYSEINLNCGCPSPRVSKRCFGAKLMESPELVREIVSTMSRKTSSQSITVKCRIGVDNKDSYAELCEFLLACNAGGVNKFIIHSRKCLLKGLSTKQNRDIPPLKYDVVHRLVQEFPDLQFVLNGGITSLCQAKSHINSPWIPEMSSELITNNTNNTEYPGVHGVMIGRAAYANPLIFATADSQFFNSSDVNPTRRELLERYISYCEDCQNDRGAKKITLRNELSVASTSILLKPVHSVFNGCQNNTQYKQLLNDLYVERVKQGHANPSCREVIEGACEIIFDRDLDAPIVDQHHHHRDFVRRQRGNTGEVEKGSKVD